MIFRPDAKITLRQGARIIERKNVASGLKTLRGAADEEPGVYQDGGYVPGW